ncbi:MAG: hypothetical protein R8K46_10995 [Mariprofundaceae bacterium]
MDIKLFSPGKFFLYGVAIMIALAAPSEGQAWSYGYSYGHYGGHHYYGYSNHYYGRHSHYPAYGYSRHNYRYHPERRSYSVPASAYQQDSAVTIEHGWTQLRNKHPSEALTTFGRLAEASPSKGLPKVGYALASAELGRLGKAAWAMRRALRIDPDSFHYVALDKQLNSSVAGIIQQYEKKLAYDAKDQESAFMLASLHYLLGHMDAAHVNIDQAILAHDESSSTRNLKRLINREPYG